LGLLVRKPRADRRQDSGEEFVEHLVQIGARVQHDEIEVVVGEDAPNDLDRLGAVVRLGLVERIVEHQQVRLMHVRGDVAFPARPDVVTVVDVDDERRF
jgi:fructose-specific component phosphotransferase system IIB-like protein